MSGLRPSEVGPRLEKPMMSLALSALCVGTALVRCTEGPDVFGSADRNYILPCRRFTKAICPCTSVTGGNTIAIFLIAGRRKAEPAC